MDHLTPQRVLQIAMELEQTGQVFYEFVATGCGPRNQNVAKLFHRLAAEETHHFAIFSRMLADLEQRTGEDVPPLTAAQEEHIRDLLNGRVLPDPIAARQAAHDMTLPAALDLAIEMERNAVAFYSGVLVSALSDEDAAEVSAIIAEEQRHEDDLVESRRLV